MALRLRLGRVAMAGAIRRATAMAGAAMAGIIAGAGAGGTAVAAGTDVEDIADN